MEEMVRVVARLRPFLPKEIGNSQNTSSSSTTEKCVVVHNSGKEHAQVCLTEPVVEDMSKRNSSGNEEARSLETMYSFDGCYDENVGQEELFNKEVKGFVGDVLQGHHATVLCYGMTGTGKTFTMQGTKEQPGFVPRSIQNLFRSLKNGVFPPTTQVTASFLQIYNEQVYDLFQKTQGKALAGPLSVLQNHNKDVVVQGLTEVPLTSAQTFQRIFTRACRRRQTSATNCNETSSRSHALLTVKVEFNRKVTEIKAASKDMNRQGTKRFKVQRVERLRGVLNLVDLAGNEDNRISGNRGQTLQESATINQSLFVLHKVVKALNERRKNHTSSASSAMRIPYRDSKLTRLLQDSIGGRGRTVLICNLAPGIRFFNMTLRTLEFGSLSRSIVNAPVVNAEEVKEKERALEEQLRQKLEKWNNRKSTKRPRDNLQRGAGRRNLKRQKIAPVVKKSQTHLSPERKSARERAIDLRLLSPYVRERCHAILQKQNPLILEKLEQVASQINQCSALFLEQNTEAAALLEEPLGVVQSVLSSMREDSVENQPSQPEEPETLQHDETVASPCAQPMVLNPSILTPLSKVQRARLLVKEAKALEKAGKTRDALEKYISAGVCVPKLGKLQRKIASLHSQLERAPATEGEKSSTVSSSDNTANVAKAAVCRKSAGKENQAGAKQRVKVLQARVGEAMQTVVEKNLLHVLNRGSMDELLKLKSIGPKRAERIVEERAECPFKQLSDLHRIGFSAKLQEQFYSKNALPSLSAQCVNTT